jgi:hypothetical protein
MARISSFYDFAFALCVCVRHSAFWSCVEADLAGGTPHPSHHGKAISRALQYYILK